MRLLPLALHISFVLAQHRKCNGFAGLCDKSLGNVTFIGAHDSFAVEADSTGLTVSISSNQYKNVSQQLSDGVRMLQGQGHSLNSSTPGINLCHTNCQLLNGGSLTSYLEKVAKFLEANPYEVLIFLWVNSEEFFDVTSWADSYKAAGLDKYSYVPKSLPVKNTEWPTLGELISNGTRVVSFLDIGAGGVNTSKVPYLLDEFSMIFETIPDPKDNGFACDLDRPKGGSPEGSMYLINHNLNTKIGNTITVPDTGAVNTTNAACGLHAIGQQVDNCIGLYDRNPNVILLDCGFLSRFIEYSILI